MDDHDRMDTFRRKAREVVQQLSDSFLKPEPETYIREVLATVHAGSPVASGLYVSAGLRDAFWRFIATQRQEDNGQQRGRNPLEGASIDDRRVLERASPTVQFDAFLDQLLLDERDDLARIAKYFSRYSIRVQIKRDSISADYPDSFGYTLHLYDQDGDVFIVGSSVTNVIAPFSISCIGPIARSAVDAVLKEVYAFFVLVAMDSVSHRAGESES